jgi:hypothetical protein
MSGTALCSFRQFIEDPSWFGWAFREPSFAKWRALLLAVMGELLTRKGGECLGPPVG